MSSEMTEEDTALDVATAKEGLGSGRAQPFMGNSRYMRALAGIAAKSLANQMNGLILEVSWRGFGTYLRRDSKDGARRHVNCAFLGARKAGITLL